MRARVKQSKIASLAQIIGAILILSIIMFIFGGAISSNIVYLFTPIGLLVLAFSSILLFIIVFAFYNILSDKGPYYADIDIIDDNSVINKKKIRKH